MIFTNEVQIKFRRVKQHAMDLHTKSDVAHQNHFFIWLQEGPGGRLPDAMMYGMDHLELPRPQTPCEKELS
jgi:hypothetical protein